MSNFRPEFEIHDLWDEGQLLANITGKIHVLVGTERSQRVQPIDETEFRIYNNRGSRIGTPTIFRVFFPGKYHGKL